MEPEIGETNSIDDIQPVHLGNSGKDKREIRQILNNLKDSINEHYGLYEGAPCVNSGPCGNFANLFYQKWNERFDQKVSISFIMSADSSECYHVLIKLPNDDYYDGGNGILTRKYIIKGYEEGMYIIEMLELGERYFSPEDNTGDMEAEYADLEYEEPISNWRID